MTHIAESPRTNPSEAIAREIRAEIGRQQMTSRRLALMSGMSYEWLKRRITTCTVPMTFEDVDLIAQALGVPASQFYRLPRVDSNHQPAGYLPSKPGYPLRPVAA